MTILINPGEHPTTIAIGTALFPGLVSLGDPNTGLWFPALDTIAISTGGIERLRIDNNGNIGINCIPGEDYKLDILGNVRINGQLTSIATTGTAPFIISSTTPVANLSIGGTAAKANNLTSGLLGSIPYQSAVDTTILLSPNITTIKKFLTQTGITSASTAPVWDDIVAGDIANSIVMGKLITGFTSGSGALAATDTILQAIQKLDGNDTTTLNSAKSYADTLVLGLWDDRGSFDASINTFPTTGGSGPSNTILKGDIWTISIAATSGDLLNYAIGTNIRALINNPEQIFGNWAIIRSGIGYVSANVATGLQQFAATTSAQLAEVISDETGTGALVFANTPTLISPILGTPTSGNLASCTFPTLNQSTTGSANSLKSPATTGLTTITGPTVGTTRAKTVRDADDTILELGGTYTTTGTWLFNNTVTAPKFNVGTLSYIASNALATMQSSVVGFDQVIIQNSNTGATASSDFVVNNNLSTDTTYYGDFGINSSNYSGSGSLALPNATYLTATTGDLVLGTITSNAIHFIVNNGTTDALNISTTGVLTLGNTLIVPAGTALLPSIITAVDLNTGIWFPAVDTVALSTAGSERLRVDANGNVGIGNTPSGTYKLEVNGAFAATTKSFKIDHPSKPGYKLEYGSLESPYHGVRLTGRDTMTSGGCAVNLPNYISSLVYPADINIQLTLIKSSAIIWVDDINIEDNNFIVRCNVYSEPIEFFWTFTAIRKDVDSLIVESLQ